MAKELVSWKVVSRDSTRRHQEKPRNTETGSGNGTTELRVFYLFIFRERKGCLLYTSDAADDPRVV